MKSLLEIHALKDIDPAELLDFVLEESQQCRDKGDSIGAGEWLKCALSLSPPDQSESYFARIVAYWASASDPRQIPGTVAELIQKINDYPPEELTLALTRACLCLQELQRPLPGGLSDLGFRLAPSFRKLFGLDDSVRNKDLVNSSLINLQSAFKQFQHAVDAFMRTTPTTAKLAAIEFVKISHKVKRFMLAQERAMLIEVESLLGPGFRKFCEHCEAHNAEGIVRRSNEISHNASQSSALSLSHQNSSIWKTYIEPVIRHTATLAEQSRSQIETLTMPSLSMVHQEYKLNLMTLDSETSLAARVVNNGQGTAYSVRVTIESDPPLDQIRVTPDEHFDLQPGSEQSLSISVLLQKPLSEIKIMLLFAYTTITGINLENRETLCVQNQVFQPDWTSLQLNPPYSLKPVLEKSRLYGRDSIIQDLMYAASAGTSTFLWGQKRVGKTSVLQVLAGLLREQPNKAVAVLRMGHLAGMHEGQVAHVLAVKLMEEAGVDTSVIPDETQFGAGLGTLIPIIEKFTRRYPGAGLIAIIDEFDDLDPSFYLGERGRLFVKALRSLAETGLTFFLVGSERMQTIADKHSQDLNQWSNVRLDSIGSSEDCKALITQPVDGAIEYSPKAIRYIVDFCASNPYYMNIVCAELFKRCLSDKRSYVSESDIQNCRAQLPKALAPTNFSHFWDDNPSVDAAEKSRHSAENCLFLAAVSQLGSQYDSISDVYDVQDSLEISPSDLLSQRELQKIEERLLRRGILERESQTNTTKIKIPIFQAWLRNNATFELLPKWRQYQEHSKRNAAASDRSSTGGLAAVSESSFPIPEDDLIAVAQNLIYLGKQKDVAEIRRWLSQFGDDVRIDIAFQLLKRLAEKGYISEGARLLQMDRVIEAVTARRKEIGDGLWRLVRGCKVNLCVTYVDSPSSCGVIKSGGVTAKEFKQRFRPGKCVAADKVEPWMKENVQNDALLVIIDDFAGTGRTMSKGVSRFLDGFKNQDVLDFYLKENRILCCTLFAFPEAIDLMHKEHPGLYYFVAKVFDQDVRALDPDAEIFDSPDEIIFARDMLVPIGRELSSQNQLGCGDMGALVVFHNTVPNNTLPIFWSDGLVADTKWCPLFPRV